jgi:hypothetical protein
MVNKPHYQRIAKEMGSFIAIIAPIRNAGIMMAASLEMSMLAPMPGQIFPAFPEAPFWPIVPNGSDLPFWPNNTTMLNQRAVLSVLAESADISDRAIERDCCRLLGRPANQTTHGSDVATLIPGPPNWCNGSSCIELLNLLARDRAFGELVSAIGLAMARSDRGLSDSFLKLTASAALCRICWIALLNRYPDQ